MKLKDITPEQRKQIECLNCNNRFLPISKVNKFCKPNCRSTYNSRLNYKRHPEIKKIRSKIWKDKNKEKLSKRHKERKLNDKFYSKKKRIRSRHRKSLISKYSEHVCKKCKIMFQINKIEIHHPDWDEPEKYDLLCINCHVEVHKSNKLMEKLE